jgi:hypothetical protein
MRALDHSRLNFSGGEGGHHFWPLVPWETGADGVNRRGNGPPDRLAKGTPWRGIKAAALAPA